MTKTTLPKNGNHRVIIEKVQPSCDGGAFPVRRIIGDEVAVKAHIFADGHDVVKAVLQHKPAASSEWVELDLAQRPNDEWEANFFPEEIGYYEFTIVAWVDPFFTWLHGFRNKVEASQNLLTEVEIGIAHLRAIEKRMPKESREPVKEWLRLLSQDTVPLGEKVQILLGEDLHKVAADFPDRSLSTTLPKPMEISVERKRAGFSSWYEFFPRSCTVKEDLHGTFDEAQKYLPQIASLGFNVVYLPPIHPIGNTHRKGRNNTLEAGPTDVGSPWAIGSSFGGHKAIHPSLGDLDSFQKFVWAAGEHGLEVAMDIAFQCSPDHPYVKEHPEWFKWRPDGTVQYAENPPKKYQDIIPFDFECKEWKELWEELKSVFLYWIECGIRIFRVDNPHTKPLPFWQWVIREIKTQYPDVIFLSEAFTRPKLKYWLGKAGFTQGYTYFTWRNTKEEIESYLQELCKEEVRNCFWPNFWPNTPDILPEVLQYGGRPAFLQKLVLAATLSSNYGMYGPAYIECVSEAYPGKEEYHYSEKYEIKCWNPEAPGNINRFIRRLNHIRRDQPALQQTFQLKFIPTDNTQLVAYMKRCESGLNIILTVVNLDPYNEQSGWIEVPLEEYGIDPTHPFLVQDLLPEHGSDLPKANYLWNGPRNFIKLNPHNCPAHIFRIFRKQQREQDFDYWL